jgi:LPS-assembly lipoprotein
MSSSDETETRFWPARTRGLSLGVLIAVGLAGCVEPLYGPGLGGGSVADEMRAIKVEPIPDRIGHYLTNDLIFALNGTGSTPTPKYRLVVIVHERLSTPIYNSVIGAAEAGDVNVAADYKLYKIAGDSQPVTSGTVSQFVIYDRSLQRLSNVRAARDAEQRNASTLADQIRTRIAVAFDNRHD